MNFDVRKLLSRAEELKEQIKEPIQVGEARILVVGAGGAGNNSVTRLMGMGGAKGAKTISINTDAQHLNFSKADSKILIGEQLTQGLGAGGYPEIGRQAAQQSRNELRQKLRGAHLVFLTCGLGGGTGTGSLPVVAEIAKSEGAIVVASVTTPFDMEKARLYKAEEGLMELRENCDTVIVIDNNKLVELVPHLPLNDAFAYADNLIAGMIKGISETITTPSLVNLDYADIRTIMTGGGVAMIGVGEGTNAEECVNCALKHPLIDVDATGGNGAIIHVSGGPSMTLAEVTKASKMISSQLSPTAHVIWGARVDPTLGDKMRIMTIITGVNSPNIVGKNSKFEPRIMLPDEAKPEMLQELCIDYVS
ncbi:MAG: cell division protein FtsZ [archaeon]